MLSGNGFGVHLAAPSSFKDGVFGSNRLSMRASNMHSHRKAVIERRCSIGANHAQNYQLTSSDPKTRHVTIARLGIIRARFNKRSTLAFPKADRRSNICNTPLPNSNIDEVCCVCLAAAASSNGEHR
jgi:hypothetical protein